ncbi:multisubunit Na+/H+ antiporter, MnhF subunit [Sanguibacter keddieii DSM 10542]|jgi:multicomponent Na+:H+ antiporter subunit F|uniref:Multisubunit Na+/H+ antiporter, MnhF subunit n=1 Tax=Sanguibacter keddieii (strain ATCC 51767 / DSM 10542 / NCFB 3025 / ST-74) TaxID=446469 RepID=D1BKX4_SANKS|nr:monovalent cation/H+ antiporter complex subunit F [Sanguibacter keddieii]ACZ22601.1 multisubunit Na+/H+ antiporter, MnhF subunit [Sanguibacter keddieii DSM 10542]
MTGIDVALALLVVACLASTYRMIAGPAEADRVVAADLLLFGMVGIIALVGVRTASAATFDIVLVASMIAFLGALSLARTLTRGNR